MDGTLAEKLGFSWTLRRSKNGYSLLVSLMMTHEIIKLTIENLQHLLDAYGVSVRKTSTKSFRIRQLMKLDLVQEACGDILLQELEEKLTKLDKRRNNKNETREQEEDECEEPRQNSTLID